MFLVPYVCYLPPRIWSYVKYSADSYDVRLYAVCSILLVLPPSLCGISSSAICSQILVFRRTKFHTVIFQTSETAPTKTQRNICTNTNTNTTHRTLQTAHRTPLMCDLNVTELNTYEGSKVLAPLILNFGARWKGPVRSIRGSNPLPIAQ